MYEDRSSWPIRPLDQRGYERLADSAVVGSSAEPSL